MRKQLYVAPMVSAFTLAMAACSSGGGGGGGTPIPDPDFVSCQGSQCTLQGVIDENYTLTADREWTLRGFVRVGRGNESLDTSAAIAQAKADGVTLTIDAGTHVRAERLASLAVTRGSKINAVGRADAPITFSSAEDDDFAGEGEWGGIILQGFSRQFGKGDTGACDSSGQLCNVPGEGGPDVGFYGGSDVGDSSGTMRYVRMAEGGVAFDANNEINGLTLQGVGHGTTLEYIQVQGNQDDAVEWFGGTVNARYLVLTGNDDDDIDYDEGYRGNIQFVIAQKDPNKAAPTGGNDPRGIEANSGGSDFVSTTEAKIANLTLISGPISNSPNSAQPGALLRGAVKTDLINTAIKGYNGGCIRIQDAPSVNAVVNLVNVFGDCGGNYYFDARQADSSNVASAERGVSFDAACAITNGDAVLAAPVSVTAVNNGSGFQFTSTNYVGAVQPGTAANQAWWAGWTFPGTVTCNTAP